VTETPADYEQRPWHQEAGPTAFEPFPADTSYFGRPEQVWMINFRVRDLAAMVTQLQAAGLNVTVDPERAIPMDVLPGCTIPKAILSSCGNLRAGTDGANRGAPSPSLTSPRRVVNFVVGYGSESSCRVGPH